MTKCLRKYKYDKAELRVYQIKLGGIKKERAARKDCPFRIRLRR
jgi:hypothetical protein